MGANGVGKSTLLHSIMGKPSLEVTGSAKFLDQELTEMEVDERANMGMFIGFQAPTSIPGLSNFQFIKQVKKLGVTEIKDIPHKIVSIKPKSFESVTGHFFENYFQSQTILSGFFVCNSLNFSVIM